MAEDPTKPENQDLTSAQDSPEEDSSVDETIDAVSAAGEALDEIQNAASGIESAVGSGASNSDDQPDDTPDNLDLPNFQQVLADIEETGIDLLNDVELDVKIELGRTDMLVEDVLRLTEGSVVELDKLAGDPVDIFVNNRLVARGEVLVLNDNFCVRINEIVTNLENIEENLHESQEVTA